MNMNMYVLYYTYLYDCTLCIFHNMRAFCIPKRPINQTISRSSASIKRWILSFYVHVACRQTPGNRAQRVRGDCKPSFLTERSSFALRKLGKARFPVFFIIRLLEILLTLNSSMLFDWDDLYFIDNTLIVMPSMYLCLIVPLYNLFIVLN